MLTERDIHWLRFMGRMSVVTAQHLMMYSGKSKAIVSRRLIHMEQQGVVGVAPMTVRGRKLYHVTTEGRRTVGLPGKHRGVRLADVEHDLLVAWWFMQEELRHPDSEFHTDREIRSLEWQAGRHGLKPEFAVARRAGRTLMFPDFVRVTGDRFLAYELEYTPKYLKRTIENMEAYAAAENVAAVLYACPARVVQVVRKAAAKVNEDRRLAGVTVSKIHVVRIEEGGDYGFTTAKV